MSSGLKGVHEHMIGLGLGALAHANWHANYHSPDNVYWSELSVLQAAHACEILIKARIAQEHPLLIFEQLPKAAANGEPLSLHRLIEGGRTYQFADLPDRLWATTGLALPAVDRYRAFGRLRNSIQHFSVPPEIDTSTEAVRFIYEVIDPFIHQCWGFYAIDYNEDTEPYVYLIEGLIRRGIRFLVSFGAAEILDEIDIEWPDKDSSYRSDMEARFALA
ncbi:MAG TPA: hypothetical protein VHY35_02870 [Stellaceae bacterium]|jgi:hypothetical protein|nr:hypothetical protein [Stellaceae bacterium]